MFDLIITHVPIENGYELFCIIKEELLKCTSDICIQGIPEPHHHFKAKEYKLICMYIDTTTGEFGWDYQEVWDNASINYLKDYKLFAKEIVKYELL